MLDKNTLINVTNRGFGTLGYSIPDLGGLKRSFNQNETKEITMEELRKLSYSNGGAYIIKNCLRIDNEEAVAELLGETEPEYYYSVEDVEKLLLQGSLDQLKDCLDFAPKGIIELVKEKAVSLKINDLSKREAIRKTTGFDVSQAIMINEQSTEAADEVEKTSTRRAAPVNSSDNAPQRRTEPPKYKITSIQN